MRRSQRIILVSILIFTMIFGQLFEALGDFAAFSALAGESIAAAEQVDTPQAAAGAVTEPALKSVQQEAYGGDLPPVQLTITPPSNLTVVSATYNNVSLTWMGSESNLGIAGYEIYRNGEKISTTTDTNFVDSGLTPDTTYTYYIKAFDTSNNISEASNSIAATTDSYNSQTTPSEDDTEAPSAPAGLTVASKTDSSVGIVWTASTDNTGVAGYEVYRAVYSDDNIDPIKVGSTIQTNFSDSGLIPNTKYIYTIKAFDLAGNISEASNMIVVTTNSVSTVTVKTVPFAGGYRHSILLKSDGTVWTWGNNLRGELGNGTNDNSLVPVQVSGLSSVMAVASGADYSLALRSDGTVWSWGSNSDGQLGNGSNIDSNIPVQVSELSDITAISAGRLHGMALKKDGTVWAWGANEYGQLGNGTTDSKNIPIMVGGVSGVTAISAGDSHSIVLENDGSVWTWGANWYGQLGNGTTENSSIPVLVNGLSGVAAISAGGSYSIALENDGSVWAWGANWYGQLGNGTTENSSIPVLVNGLSGVTAISAGGVHSITLKNDGTVWTWGANWDGQLGSGSTDNTKLPIKVEALSGITAIAAGDSHSLAEKDDGTVWTWGANWYGQLGDTTTASSTIPILVGSDTRAPSAPGELKVISTDTSAGLSWVRSTDNAGVAGYDIYRDGAKIATVTETVYSDTNLTPDTIYTYFVKAFDSEGNISESSNSAVTDWEAPSTPTQLVVSSAMSGSISLSWVASSDNVGVAGYEIYRDDIKIGTSTSSSYVDAGLMPETTYTYYVKAFDAGQNISEESNSVSASTTELGSIKSVPAAGGANHTVVCKDDGTVVAWGANSSGQIGDGTTIEKYNPVQVPALDNVAAVAAGESHSVALKKDGTVWAWGANGEGQLGDGTSVYKYTPVQVHGLSAVNAVASGYYHNAALSDGRVWTWGANWDGELGDGTTASKNVPVRIESLTDVKDIKCGEYHTIAIKNDGTVWTWGYNEEGQLGNGTTQGSNVPVEVQGLTDVVAAVGGGVHSIALKSDGTVWAWGGNWYGQLGDGTTTDSLVPVQVQGLTNVIAIAAGEYHCIALKNDGTVWSWGANWNGQLGDGTWEQSNIPVQVWGLSGITSIAAGEYHTLALKNDGTIWTWGSNSYGQLGNGAAVNSNVPVEAVTATEGSQDNEAPTAPTGLTVLAKSSSSVEISWNAAEDSIEVTGYQVYRDGTKIAETTDLNYSDSGLMPDTTYIYTVKAYDAGGNISEASSGLSVITNTLGVIKTIPVAGGAEHSIAVKSGGTVWTWGNNDYGQLGDGTNTSRYSPVQVSGLAGIKAVSGGDGHTIALKDNGTVWSWGANGYGQLGNSSNTNFYTPVQVKGLTGVTAIASGEYHNAVVSGGAVWTWGANFYGQLGVGSTSGKNVPVQIEGLTGVSDIACGEYHTVALKDDGTVWTWGDNSYGQLGDGTTTGRYSPVQVQGLSEITAIAAGRYQTFAIKNDGTVWAWGANWSGQLGDGTTSNSGVPVQVENISGVKAIGAGSDHSMALKSDGTVWTWGYNYYGQLGDSSTTNRYTPVQVQGLTGVTAVAGGEIHSIALKDDDTVWTWGYNGSGQLGDATTVNSSIPVLAAGDTKAPTAPTALTASATENTAALTWTASTDNVGVTGYEIYRNEEKIGTSNSTTYSDIGLSPDTTYIYTVKAFDEAGNLSGESNQAIRDYSVPTAPTNLTVTSKMSAYVSLSWTASADNIAVTGYEVYRNGEKAAETTQLSYSDRGLTPNTSYIYTVKAYDAGKNLSEDSNEVTQTTDPLGAINPVVLAAGSNHTIAIKNSGDVSAWGNNSSGQLGYGTASYSIIPAQISGISGIAEVSGGTAHTTALKDDGTVWTWGNNPYGQLGDGTAVDKSVYVEVKGLTGVTAISSRYYQNAAVSDGTVWTWGYNNCGQLGDGTTTNRTTPVQVQGLTDIVSTATGYYHTVALKSDGTVWTWGNNGYGQLGDGTNSNRFTPVQVQGLSGIIAIAAGYYHTIALKSDGTVWSWGYNGYKQLGDGTWISRNTPVQVQGLTGIIAVSAGKDHNAAIKSDGTVWTWGDNEYGQLGNGATSYGTNPMQVLGLTDVRAVACGDNHTVVQKGDGTIWTWGYNGYGQLGDGTTVSKNTPVLAAGDIQAPAIPASLTAVSTESSVTLTWAASTDNVGVAGYEIYRDDVKVGTVTGLTYTDSGLTAGVTYTYTVKAFDAAGNISAASNSVVNDIQVPSAPADLIVSSAMAATVVLNWTASTDNVGVTGYEIYRDGTKVGTTTDTTYTDTRLVPETTYTYLVKAYDAGENLSEASNSVSTTTKAVGTINFVPIAGGDSSTVFRKSDGTVWAWGYNYDGELGDGTYDNKILSTQVPGLTDVAAVAAGSEHTLALKNDGTVLSWGYNGYGQLGDNTNYKRNNPVQIQGLNGVTSIKAGYNHSLALIDGRVWAWGQNSLGQLGNGTWTDSATPVQVQGLTGVVAIAAGGSHNLALKDDGTVWAWGYNYYGQLGDTSYSRNAPVQVGGLSDIIAVAAGGSHSIALKSDGTVWTWGYNCYGQLGNSTYNGNGPIQVQNLTGISAIAGGTYHSIALKEDGTVWTWGFNQEGELGDGTNNNQITPVQVSGLDGVTSIGAGHYHSVAVKSDNTIWTWGSNWYGQLGDGTTTDRNTPVLVVGQDNMAPSAPTDLKAVSTETTVTLTWTASKDNIGVSGYDIYRDGIKIGTTTEATYSDSGLTPEVTYTYTVKAYDAAGNLSEASSPMVNDCQAPSAPSDLTVASKMSARINLTWTASTDNVGVTGYEIYRNGINIKTTTETSYTDVKLNPNTTYTYYVKAVDAGDNQSYASSTLSVTTEPLTGVKAVPAAGGAGQSLAVKGDGTVWTWGYNDNGQLGSGTTTNRTVPGQVQGLNSIVAVAGGSWHSLALKSDGRVWSWGYNYYGQLGNNSSSNSTIPVSVQGLTGVTAIAAGCHHSMALSDGYVWTWGCNGYGQLGDGTNQEEYSPVQINGLDGIIDVSAGTDHSLALKNDGTVWAWGYNGYGQLGDGTTTSRNTPTQIEGLTDVIAIAAGSDFSMALKKDGTVWAWGYNYYGQLGDGTTTNRNTPIEIQGLVDVVGIAAGGYHSIALKSDGTVLTCGNNYSGQLGDGTTTNKNTPIQVQGLTGVAAVAAGDNHSLAVKGDNTVWTWGYNWYGQLGDGTNTNRLTPVGAGDTQAPTVPTNLTSSSTETSVTLTWTAATDNVGVTGYEVYRNGSKLTDVTEAAYTDTGINSSETYIYTVKAFDAAGNMSEPSNQATNDYAAPTAPADLAVSAKTTTTITLIWSASTDDKGVAGYEVYRNGVKAADIKDTTYTDTGLTQNTTYNYYIKAYDAGGNISESSNVLSAATESDTNAPTVPANLNVTSESDNSISLAWTASIDNIRVTGYEIYRNGVKIDTSINAMYIDNEIVPGTYVYTVKAFDAAGNISGGSNAVTVDNQPPTQPTDLTVPSKKASSITLAWTASTDNVAVTGYEIYRDGTKVGTSVGTSYTDSGLNVDSTYTYTVKAYDESGNISGLSSVLTVSTELDTQAPSVPVSLKAASRTGSTVSLTWTASTDDVGVVGYKIYRDGTEVGSSAKAEYTDTGLTANTIYIYEVKAYDASGNTSGVSNAVSAIPMKPHITSMEPVDGVTIGGNASQKITVNFTNYGNLSGYSAAFEYSQDGSNWTQITGQAEGPYTKDSNTLYISKNWNLSALVSGSYSVRSSVYDASGSKDQLTAIYQIDRTAPAAPQNLSTASDAGGNISLAWEASPDADVSYYQVYRSDSASGSFTALDKVTGRDNVVFTDKAVQSGNTYYYKVTAVDKFEQVSSDSSVVSGTAVQDTVPPVILGIEPLNGSILGPQAKITVRAEDGLSLSGIKLQYSVTNGEAWIDIGNVTTSDNAEFEWNTAPLNGEVKVRAIAIDSSGNNSSGNPVYDYVIDNQGPVKVTGLSAVSSASSVILRWNDVSDQDFSYFQVERKNLDGTYESVGKVYNKLGMIVSGLGTNTNYFFRVVAYDTLGNRGTASDEISVTTTEDTTAPVVTGLQPDAGYYAHQIQLSATVYDNVAAASVTFQRSTDRNTWSDIASVTPTGTADKAAASYNLDISSMQEGSWYIRALARDTAGNVSSGEPVNEYIVDRTAPKQPEGFTITPSAGYITLNWSQGTEVDLNSYRVYRSLKPEGPYAILKDGLQAIGYMDRDVQSNTTYYYKLTSIDKAGNESIASQPISAQLLADTEAPAILSLSKADGTTLPANPEIKVLASDNYRLSRISMEYQSANSPDVWIAADSKDIGETYSDIADLKWTTTGLPEGSYSVKITAFDANGNASEPKIVHYNLNLLPPAVPKVTAVPGGWSASLAWTSGTESDLAGFRLYRSTTSGGPYSMIQQTKSTNFIDTQLTDGITYYYVVEALDNYLNASRSSEVVVIPTTEDKIPPTAEAGDNQTVALGMQAGFDGTLSKDNNRISKYLWDFGDGTTSNMAQPVHEYAETGTYTVKITVYDPAGNSASDTTAVKVLTPQQVGILEVNVLDETGEPIPNASVVIEALDGTSQKLTANSRGVANISAVAGTYKVYAYQTNYMPASTSAVLAANQRNTININLKTGDVVVGELSAKRMSLGDIEAAGIDITVPENQYVYEFVIDLGFEPQKYIVNGEGKILSGSDYFTIEDNVVYPEVIPYVGHPEVQPTVAYIIVPGEASWLKEFFEVTLKLQNTADPEFSLTDSKAVLTLPEGLSLAPISGGNEQKTEIDLGTIAGGEEKDAKWIIRGDEQGSYYPQAQFNGTLQPFEAPVEKHFVTQEPVKVWGSSAMKMHVKAEDWAFAGEPYHVLVGLENVSDHTVYNATLKIGESVGYVLESNSPSSISVPELKPGEDNIIWIDVCLIPSFEGCLDLSNTFTLNIGGNANIDTVYETIESPRKQYHLQPEVDPQTMEADPINTSTGAHVIQRSLLTVNGIRPIPFGVSYNSQLLDEGPLGKGWSHDFETRLEQLEDGNIIIHWNANSWNKYYGNGSNEFTSPDLGEKLDKLVKNQDGSYTLTRNDQTVYRFNSAGQLVQLQNKNSQYVEMTYDTEGKLETITEPVSGQTLTISYNADGLIEKVTDKLNRQVTFAYDDAHNLTAITDANAKTITYTYNSDGRVLTSTDADGVRIFSDTYDNQGRIIEQDDAVDGNQTTKLSYDTASDPGKIITSVTDREGNKRVLTHNRKYQLINVSDKLGNTTAYTYDSDGNRIKAVDAKGNTFSYNYDAKDNLTSIIDAAGHETSMNYDDRNNILSVQNAVYKDTNFTYDTSNNITSITDPDGNTISHTYDSNGLMLTTTNPGQGTSSYNYENGKLKNVTDPVGNTTTYGYDAAGRMISVTDAVYKTTTFEYDNADNLIKVTDPLGNFISYTYDSRHNRLTEADAKGNVTSYAYNGNEKLTSVTDALNNQTKFEYDGEDRLIKTIDAKGNVSKVTYDSLGRVTALTDPLGNTTNMHYDAVGNLISQEDAMGRQILSITYDELNNPLTVTDAIYRTVTNHYDSLNRIVETIDAMGRSTKYNYDNLNRMISVVDALNGQSAQSYDADGNLTLMADPNNNQTSFKYDKAGRMLSETSANGSTTTYEYGPGNYLAKETNGRGQAATYQYDDAGQLTNFSDPAGTVNYTYDANSNVVTASDDKGIISRDYDQLDRIVKYKDASGNEIQYNYDEVGNLVTLTYPDGKQVKYTYDSANRMTGVTDWAGRTTNYEYDVNGRLSKTTRPNGTVQTLSYDAAGQLLEQKDTDKNGNVISQYSFSYDAAGNVTSELSGIAEQDFEVPQSVSTYVYGNRLDTFNGQTITFDQDGNMLKGPLGGVMTDFEYDSRNRLVKAGDTSYTYDAENNRISVTNGVYSDSYVINPTSLSQVLIKTDENGKKTYYVYGLGLIGQEEDGAYKSYHFDRRGSTVALTDIDGNVTGRYQYGPYGELVYRTGETETPFLYNGKYGVMTDRNGLYYMRARYYSPELKRFINQDVLRGSITDGRSMNHYAYANGNPVSNIDPFGLSAEEEGNSSNYLQDSFEQLFLGNYTDKVTLLGTGAEVAAGFFDVDILGDARDVTYDFQHWKWSWGHVGKTGLDAIGLLPVLGMLKYTDEAATLVKGAGKAKVLNGADNIANGAKLKTYYQQAEKYGTGSIKELPDGRFRFYGELKAPIKEGEMAGARFVREWNPATGAKRNWYETIDHAGNIRQVRPDPNITGGVKTHYMFDSNGNFTGSWIPKR